MYLFAALFHKAFEMTHNNIHSNKHRKKLLPLPPPKKESEPREELLV